MRNFKQILLPGVLAFFVFIACSKTPASRNYSKSGLVLSGDQQVPPIKVPSTGLMDVKYNTGTHVLNFTVTWAGLTGTPTGAHIHGTAPRGVNTSIKYNFFSIFPRTTSGSFTNSVMIDTVGIKEDSLLLGYYYLNIHTPANPGGEIRGQIEF